MKLGTVIYYFIKGWLKGAPTKKTHIDTPSDAPRCPSFQRDAQCINNLKFKGRNFYPIATKFGIQVGPVKIQVEFED